MNLDWLFWKVPDDLIGVFLIVIAIACFVWGGISISAAYAELGDRTRPRWHPRRWYPNSFGLWLGIFLTVVCAGVFVILGLSVWLDTEGTDAWAVGYVALCFVITIMALGWWRREKFGVWR